jgi:hypothetical protein
MATNSIKYTYEPLSLRDHVATVMAVMAGVAAVGTWLSYEVVRVCDTEDLDTTCESVPPAVAMLVGLGLVAAAALFLGALLLWAPLRRRIDPARL